MRINKKKKKNLYLFWPAMDFRLLHAYYVCLVCFVVLLGENPEKKK